MKTWTIRIGCAVVTLLVLFSISAIAQAPAGQAEPKVDGIPISQLSFETAKITENLYILTGVAPPVPGTKAKGGRFGGPVGVLTGPDGIFMVDTQYPPVAEKLLAAIRRFSSAPIRYLVNSHHHVDHAGGNAFFTKQGATILHRPETSAQLAKERNSRPEALAKIAIQGPLTFYMNGEEIRVIPMEGGGHTDNDTIVWFKNADVLFTGDMVRVGYPNGLGMPNGGNLEGSIDHYGRMIGMIGPKTKVIPGHAPLNEWWTRQHLIEYRDFMVVTRDRIAKLIAEGKSVEQIIAANPTKDFDVPILKSLDYIASAYNEGMYPRFTNAEEYIRTYYNQVKGTNLESPLLPVGDPNRLKQATPGAGFPK